MPKNISAAKKPPTNTERPPVMREYEIGGTRYIVSATTTAGANEDAAAKVLRLIRGELTRQNAAQNGDTHEQNMKT